MRDLKKYILLVILVTILICVWSLYSRIADHLSLSSEVVDEGHEKVFLRHLEETSLSSKGPRSAKNPPFNLKHVTFRRLQLPKVLNSNDRFASGGQKSQLKLLASLATTIGCSLFIMTFILLVCAKNEEDPPTKDEAPLLSQSDIQNNDTSKNEDLQKSRSLHYSASQELGSNPPTNSGAIALPLKPPPGRVLTIKSIVSPPPPPPPPPCTNNLAPPAPPPVSSHGPKPPPPPPPKANAPPAPPLRVGRGQFPPEPPKPSKPTLKSSSAQDASERTKLKPFFWDKVLASPAQTMVWDEIRAGSFQFNEEKIESLFGYNPEEKKRNENSSKKPSSSNNMVHLIEAKKAQNLSILLKALNVTKKEVCDALLEGNELPIELLQTLLRMAPTSEEELKLRLFSGDISQISTAEQFMKALVDIPFAFKRMDCLLFMVTLKEEVSALKDSFLTLEMASNKLRSSRLFMKLLEAVLKTGNRMNDGTYRGGAQAFKLDTLLKLADVKGKDGKTTLLHFVVQEIVRSEGIKVARATRESCSISSVSSDDFDDDDSCDSMQSFHVLGLQVVSGLSTELEVIKKAAVIDFDGLTSTVSKLGHSLLRSKGFLNKEMCDLGAESRFYHVVKDFVEEAEGKIMSLLQEEKIIKELVKSTVDYFHGNCAKEEGLRLFVIVRDFMTLLDKICTEIEKNMDNSRRNSIKEKLTKISSQDSSSLSRGGPKNTSTTLKSDKDNDTHSDNEDSSTTQTSTMKDKPMETPILEGCDHPKTSTRKSITETSGQETHTQTSHTNEQLSKAPSKQRIVEEMRQKLLPIIQDFKQGDESSSSSDEDEALQSSFKGSQVQEPCLQTSRDNEKLKNILSQEKGKEHSMVEVVSNIVEKTRLEHFSSSSSDES